MASDSYSFVNLLNFIKCLKPETYQNIIYISDK